MIDCDKAQELLNDYIDGSLDPDIKNDLEIHLEKHPECKELFQQSQIIRNSFSDLDQVGVSNDFDAILRQKIIAVNNEKEKGGFIKNRRTFSFAFSATAIASVLFALVFFDFDESSQIQDSSIRQSSAVSGSISKNKSQQDTENKENPSIEDSLKQGVNNYDPDQLKLTGEGNDK